MRLIAAFKFVKAAVLIAGGVAALTLLSPLRAHGVQVRLEELSLDSDHRVVAKLAGQVLGMLDLGGSLRLSELAVAAFLIAALLIVQGVGLALARLWAQYLTVALTISFLPVEVVSSWGRFTLLRAATIGLNIGVVAYLLMRLRAARGSRVR